MEPLEVDRLVGGRISGRHDVRRTRVRDTRARGRQRGTRGHEAGRNSDEHPRGAAPVIRSIQGHAVERSGGPRRGQRADRNTTEP